jgi:hypothetical protein
MPKKEKPKYVGRKYEGYTLFGAVNEGRELAKAMQDIYEASKGPRQVEDLRVEPESDGKVLVYYKRKGLNSEEKN